MLRRVVWSVAIDVSEVRVAFIFRVRELKASYETSVSTHKPTASLHRDLKLCQRRVGTSKMGTKGNLNLSLLEHWDPVQQVGPCSEGGTVAVRRVHESDTRWEIGRKSLISCYCVGQS